MGDKADPAEKRNLRCSMNIKDAKEQIKNAMTAYFRKDKFGNYCLPPEKQRPVFLLGAPGIGKTAIMEQIAAEMGVGLLSYSMTHHTRQSALGLPFIVHKNYGGVECDVSEYTMSEIISSVYDLMETTGVSEGILFLDEINCVSETLSPIMLQFLQYKVFGRHKVPDGWIVVTAGNPPEYNNSVREFDMATWDRLKRIDIEPEFDCWKEYAYKTNIHPSIITYLEIKKDNFYKVESTVDGKTFVTARGWDDLSRIMTVYEECGLKIDKKLISQYLQNPKIAADFAGYYDMFNKYKSDYQVEDILSGKASDSIKERAKNAKFDEKLSLIGLMLDGVNNSIVDTMTSNSVFDELTGVLRRFKITSAESNEPAELLKSLAEEHRTKAAQGRKSSSLDEDAQKKLLLVAEILDEQAKLVGAESDPAKAFAIVKDDYTRRVAELKKASVASGKCLSNMFRFSEEVFGDGNEMLVIVTELTANCHSAAYISRFGCKEYFTHNKELLFFERQQEITTELEKLEDL